jgi:glycosyltransferase involved in cell wall biosynthesis
MDMKRILMVLEKDFPEDERVEKEALALINAGYEVHLAIINDQKQSASKKIYKDIIVHQRLIGKWVKKTSVGALMFSFYFNFWRNFLEDILKDTKFDYIHIHDLPLAKIGKELSIKHNCKFVLDLHEHWPALLELSPHTKTFLGRLLSHKNQWVSYETKMVNLADHLIVVIEEARDRIAKLGVPKNKISVVSNTIPIKELQGSKFDFSPPNRKIVIGYAGGIQYLRGLQEVIQALPDLVAAYPNLELWLIGGGRHVKSLKHLAEELKVKDNVLFFGHQPYSEMMKLINQFTIGLIPHLKNPLTDATIPNKLFQYMYLEKPILASNCDPIKRIIEETKTGLIHEFNNPPDIAEKVDKILKSKDLITKFGLNGKKAVESKYNWENDAKVLVKTYSSI